MNKSEFGKKISSKVFFGLEGTEMKKAPNFRGFQRVKN